MIGTVRNVGYKFVRPSESPMTRRLAADDLDPTTIDVTL
jgi:hypothetical protein